MPELPDVEGFSRDLSGLPRWLTGNRDAPDPTCPRCGIRLTRGRIAGSTSVWCPLWCTQCQRDTA